MLWIARSRSLGRRAAILAATAALTWTAPRAPGQIPSTRLSPVPLPRTSPALGHHPVLSELALSPDGKKAAYRLMVFGEPFFELTRIQFADVYLADVETGDSRRIEGVPGLHGSMRFSPDGRWLIVGMLASGQTVGGRPIPDGELYAVPVDGGEARRISPPGDLSRFVGQLLLTADGRRAIMTILHRSGDGDQLISAPLDGGTAAVLMSGQDNTDRLADLQLSPDGEWAVYMTGNFGQRRLFSVPAAGGAAVPHGAMTGVGFGQSPVAITPDSRDLIFLRGPGDASSAQLMRAPIAGGPPVTLSAVRFEEGAPVVPQITNFRIAPDGRSVAYRADLETTGVFNLYTVPFTGGGAAKLSGAAAAGSGVSIKFEYTPDSESLVFLEFDDPFSERRMMIGPAAGGTPRALTPGPAGLGDVNLDFFVRPRRVFLTALDAAGELGLFTSPVRPGAVVKLIGALEAPQTVVTESGDAAIVRTTSAIAGRNLFFVPANRAGPVQINREPRRLGSPPFVTSVDGSVVLYLDDRDGDGALEVYAAFPEARAAARGWRRYGDEGTGPAGLNPLR